MLSQEDKQIISEIGRYRYKQMKEMKMSYQKYQKYLQDKEEEKKLKQKIGYRKYHELQELGMTLDEYKRFKEETKYNNRKKYEEKNKIRYKTIRYIERYCELEKKCQICGEKAEIHHPNYKDYQKINLLCKKHHTELHNFELIPPLIIDLEKIAVKTPPKIKHEKYINEQIENIKIDILKNNFSGRDLEKKYKMSISTIKKYLRKQTDKQKLEDKLKLNGKKKYIQKKNSNKNNPLLFYKLKYNLTSSEISEITKIPLPTLRAIESGRNKLENLKKKTKTKLKTLNEKNINLYKKGSEKSARKETDKKL